MFDGGVVNNTPISHAAALGADRVVVLPTGYACNLPVPPRTALASAVHALTLLVEQRLVLDIAAYCDRIDLVVCPPLCPLSVSAADFAHSSELINRARQATSRWLDRGGHHVPHPERLLSLHSHVDKSANAY